MHEAPGYHQLADLLRTQIADGTLPAGARMPTEPALMHAHGVARQTVRRAITALRNEGLVTLVRGAGYKVRVQKPRTEIVIRPGWKIETRMPSPAERSELAAEFGHPVEEGVPVLVVTDVDGFIELFPGDRHSMVVSREL